GREPGRLAGLERAGPAQERREVLSVDVAHHDVRADRVHPEIVDRHDVRVAERGNRLRFRPESSDEFRVPTVFRAEDLHRDVAAELRIRGPVDRRHAALPEQLDEPIPAAQDAADLRQTLIPFAVPPGHPVARRASYPTKGRLLDAGRDERTSNAGLHKGSTPAPMGQPGSRAILLLPNRASSDAY